MIELGHNEERAPSTRFLRPEHLHLIQRTTVSLSPEDISEDVISNVENVLSARLHHLTERIA